MRRQGTVIELGGQRLAGLRLWPDGSGTGPTLVFLHEGLGCIGMWKDVPGRLCARTGLPGLVFDRAGHGGSTAMPRPRTPGYLHDEALLLPQVLRAAEIERPILVGHSDGGTIALLAAALDPGLAQAVVAIAAHIHVEEAALAGIDQTRQAWGEGQLRARLQRWHGAGTEALFHAWADIWQSDAFRFWSVATELRAVRCPTLLLQGSADRYATPGHLQCIADAIGGAATTHLLPGLGHSPHLEDGTGFVERVAGFLADLDGLPVRA